jgi:GTP-binding protein HflX
LLNALTGADILAENKLFATLDTTTRAYEYSRATGKQKVLLTDTVGFIRKLPHNLIDAFRSTLEEVCYADYIIHVVDASSENRRGEMKVVYETLDMLLSGRGSSGRRNDDGNDNSVKKIITIYNKIDKLTNPDDRLGLLDKRASQVLQVSAKKRIHLEDISEAIDSLLREDREYVETTISYKDMSLLAEIKSRGEILEEKYQEDGVWIKAYIPRQINIYH